MEAHYEKTERLIMAKNDGDAAFGGVNYRHGVKCGSHDRAGAGERGSRAGGNQSRNAEDRHAGGDEEGACIPSHGMAWAKQGGKFRTYLALAAIFVLLVYYHSIGKKMCVEWEEVYGD